jgi:hypothetical protein
MENELSWLDRIIIPKTQAYKNFIKEMERTPTERWMMDGEREFTEKEEKFLQIYNYKNGIKEIPVLEISVKGKNSQFSDIQKGITFFEKQNINENSDVSIKNNLIGYGVSVNNNAEKYKILSDLYAMELTQPTHLSGNLSKTQIDEKQAHYYRQYEAEAKKLDVEITPFISEKSTINNSQHPTNFSSRYDEEMEATSSGFQLEDVIDYEREDLLKRNKDREIIGKITFYDFDGEIGEVMEYTTKESYLNALEREFDHNMGAFKYETVLRNPELIKKVDDLIYGVYGENNPNSLDFYIEKVQKETNDQFKNRFKQFSSSDNDFRVIEQFSKVNIESFDNFFADRSSTIEHKKYSDLKQDLISNNYPADRIKELETLVKENTYTQQAEPNKVQIDRFIKILNELKEENSKGIEVIGGKIKDIKSEILQNPENDAQKQISEKIQALHRERNYELLADNFSAAKEIEHKIKDLEEQTKNINNQKIMETQKEFDQVKYLKDQLKYLGFGEDDKLHKDLEKGINSKKQQFEIKTTSDRTLPGNKADFTLNYNKTEKGGIFLNSYDANLTNEKGESVSQNFRVSKENSYTAKEAINLLEGRSVKIEFDNPKSKEREPAFVKLNFGEEKNQWGNYNFQIFYKKYGVDAADIVEKSNLVFDKPEFKADTIKSLEKGNVVKVKFEIEDKIIEGKAVLNPQNRNLNLYDNDMTRINTNEPIKGLEADNEQEKSNVKEQSKSRGI